MTPVEPPGDRFTAASIGVLAATLGAVSHELIGHGLGCLSDGGRITLLTSIYFKCAGATWLTDGAGPVASLAFGLISLGALKAIPQTGWLRYFLMVSALIGFGWFAGQAIYSAALNTDDWAFVARWLHWPPVWRLFAAAIGAGVYVLIARILARLSTPGELAMALAASAASAAVAGLLWMKAPIKGAVEGAAAVGIAPMLILLVMKRRQAEEQAPASPGLRSWPWIAVAAVTYGLFLIGPSRGFGPLS